MLPPGLAPPPGAPGGGGHPTPQVVNAILARMKGGPGGASPQAAPNGHGMSTLDQIQSLIQDTHDAMRNISDPNIVNVLSGCLKALTGVQATLSKTGPGGGQ